MTITLANIVRAIVVATMLVATLLAPAAAHATESTRAATSDPSRGAATDLTRATTTDPGHTQTWYAAAPPRLDAREGMIRRSGPQFWDDPWPPTWPDEFTTGASCEVACILWGRAHDNGPGSTVYINVKTTTPVHWFLEVTNEELDYKGIRANYNTMVTQAHASYAYLEPGTTYQATIRVEDAWGNIEEASGSFTTAG